MGEVLSICLKVSFLVVRLLSALSSLGVAFVVFVTGLPDRPCLAGIGEDHLVAGGLHEARDPWAVGACFHHDLCARPLTEPEGQRLAIVADFAAAQDIGLGVQHTIGVLGIAQIQAYGAGLSVFRGRCLW